MLARKTAKTNNEKRKKNLGEKGKKAETQVFLQGHFSPTRKAGEMHFRNVQAGLTGTTTRAVSEELLTHS